MARKHAVTMKLGKAVCVYMPSLKPLSVEERDELRVRIALAIREAGKLQS